jgi:hypothetical protein
MATNKLMEAAAEILAGSKSKAPAMPSQKAEDSGHGVIGGPSQDVGSNKVGDDIYASSKMNATSGAKSATAPTTKPSNASSDTQLKLGGGKKTMGEEEELSDEEVIAETDEQLEEKKQWKAKMKEDVDSLFADDSTISEEFKSKVSTIFEARVNDRVAQIEEEVEAKYADMLGEAVEEIRADLTTKVDDYLNYVVEQWLADNEIAVESGLRAEITEDFINGLRNLFAEHYIDVPEDKVDLVDELATQVETLESKLNEEIERGVSFAKALVESRKNEVTREVCEGLTATQVEKIKSLAEGVEFSTEDEYKTKLETIRENYFPSGAKKANETQLHEQLEDADDKKVEINDPFVAAVSQAISKTKI